MPKSFQASVDWFEAGPKRTVNEGDWDQGCEAAVSTGCGFSSFISALAAARNSGPLVGAAKPGMLGYTAGAEGYGHVWLVAPDPAFAYMASARAAALGRQLGHNLAYVNTAAYLRATGLPLLGYSYRHGTQRLTDYSYAGGGATPIEEDDLDAIQAAQLSNVETILGRLQNAILDPNAGVARTSSDASSAAQAAHETATTVANLITDPNAGVLHAIAQIRDGATGTDLRPVLAAIQQLPAATVAALKEAL